jgi:hypothetical protein
LGVALTDTFTLPALDDEAALVVAEVAGGALELALLPLLEQAVRASAPATPTTHIALIIIVPSPGHGSITGTGTMWFR